MVEWTPSEETKEALLKAAMGPSGNLRAPTLRLKESLFVGFHETSYMELFST